MLSAIIDIGSGSIGLALVLSKKGGVPTLRHSIRQELRVQKVLSHERLMQQSLKTLAVTITEMQKKGLGVPSKIFCFLSSHLIASQTRVVSLKFDEPTVINETVVNNIVNRESENLKNEHKRLRDDFDVIIEQKVMGVKLNGYEVSNFKNKITNEVETSIFFTLASESTLNRVRRLIAGAFHNRQIEFHSFSFAYFSFLRDLLKLERDFIFIDISGEITDISLVHDGILKKTASFPLGRNEVVSRNIGPAGKRWSHEAKLIFSKWSLPEKLPGKIFILVDPSVYGLFKNFIDSLDLSNLTLLSEKLIVKDLTSADFNKFCNNESDSMNDPALAVSTIFVNKLLN